ncbi:MAG: DivIVA domain-containing protein [Armatimonadota bacterium]|nr:DivIVA domain-containing protein [bacterium]MCS7308664.1 DivIVA domain-containing protein [Armatimonadota bacterium]MDW8103902.1 DivIVA domain-containing protein [Armatimonadota bacterium]MDW8289442.1 DivIVA domain-containing protein [Armatimonadota bacterium]
MGTPVRLTPIDITNKRFRRALRGYRPSEVDEFLAEVGADYEAVVVENAHLREQLAQAQQELERYRAIETTLKEALVLAQRTADELRASAHREVEAMRVQAELQVRQQMEQYQKAIEDLRLARQRFAIELRTTLRGMLEFVEQHLATVPAENAPPQEPTQSDSEPSEPESPHVEQPA